MAIRVQGPNGEIVEFPDGMSNDAIVGVMRQHFGGPQTPVAPQAPQKSVGRDVAEQVPFGMARGFDASLNFGPRVAELVKKYVPDEVLSSQPVLSAMVSGNALRKELANEAGADAVASDNISAARRLIPEDNEGKTPYGRYAGAFGEIVGGAALPVAGSINRLAGIVPAAKNLAYSALGSSVAGQTAKEADAPVWAQVAASLAGGLAGPNLANAAFNKGPVDPRLMEKTLAAQDAAAEGISVPRAAVSATGGKSAAGRLAALPIMGAPIQNAARSTLDQMGNRVSQIADAYGTGSQATSGANLRNAIVDYIENGSQDYLKPLWQKVYKEIDQNMLHSLPATQKLAEKLGKVPSATMRDVNMSALEPIAEDLEMAAGKGLPYEAISQMRSAIGARMENKIAPDYATIKDVLPKVYSALSKDLRTAAETAGGAKALQAFDKANTAHYAIQSRIGALKDIVGRKGDNSGENVFETLIQMAQNRGKGADLSSLAQARRTVPEQTWNDFSSAFIRRMGTDPKTGDWSPDRFLTTAGKLSPEGRNILFRGKGNDDLAASLDRLARISKQFSELTKMGNPSGTAGAAMVHTMLGGGAIGGLFNPAVWVGTGSTLGAGYTISKWFASPANVDKMTRTLQARLAATRNPNPTNIERASQMTSALANELSALNGQSAQGKVQGNQ